MEFILLFVWIKKVNKKYNNDCVCTPNVFFHFPFTPYLNIFLFYYFTYLIGLDMIEPNDRIACYFVYTTYLRLLDYKWEQSNTT